MATGNRLLPGAPVTTERAVIAEQRMMTKQRMMTGQGMADADRAAYPVGHSSEPQDGPQRLAGHGAGGRWLVWMLRGVLWLVLLLVGYRGVVAIVSDSQASPSTGSVPAATPADGYPVSLASAFALEFGQVYLNFSPATAAQRAAELAPFLPAGADPQLGWNGSGSQSTQSVQVAGVDVANAHNAVVNLLALTNGHLVEIGVPVYYADGGLVVSGQPALVPPPGPVVPSAAPRVAADPSAARALGAVLPAFFRAYASGNSVKLGAFAAPGTTLSGLDGEVAFGRISAVSVAAGHGSVRAVTVTVAWLPVSTPSAGPPSAGGGRAQLEMTYSMTVEQRAGKWYVRSIGPPLVAGPQ